MVNWVEVLKALANKNRLEIFQHLRHEGSASETPESRGNSARPEEGQGVTELARIFELSPSTVSEHLKELRRAGLINVKKTGPWVRCWVNQDMLKELSAYFAPDQGNH
ncbi:MAG: metalloregulator ArsR/SmtB family transcription factor [Clostridia bacterium]|nr:metalloregulator ArsR/SmtB family transcription factor [Clostridia bacterium]